MRSVLPPLWKLVLVLCVFGRPNPAQGSSAPPDAVIVHFNDFHGQVRPLRFPRERGGIAVLAGFVRRAEQRGRDVGYPVFVTDGGDWFQGTPEGNETRGALPVELMNRLGVDVAVLGNHEFDFGARNARVLAAAARHSVLGANILRAGTHVRSDLAGGWRVFTVRGVRIAVVGLITRDTPTTSTGPFGRLTFENEAATLERILPRVRSDSDAIILLTHCGYAVDRRLAARFPEVMLILGGHSHTSLRQPAHVGSTWIVQTGGKSSEVYRIELAVDPVAKTVRVRRAANRSLDPVRHPPDAAMEAFVASQTNAIRARWDEPVGELLGDVGGGRGLVGSTSGGSLVADLIRSAGQARIGVMNKGGIRALLRKGPVTRRQVFELLPFDNTIVSMDMTGAQLRAALEEGLASAGRPFDVSGLSYDVVAGPGGVRIRNLRLAGGTRLAAATVYRVATNSFLARGGDGAASFKAGTRRATKPVLLRELLLAALSQRSPLPVPSETRVRVVR